MIPCAMQEQVSRSDAVCRGSTPYSLVISLAIGAAITIATVLLAVAISIKAVKKAMPYIPPRLLLAFFLIKDRMASKPPFSFISAAIDATRIVTIMVSNMPLIPLPMEASAVA